MRRHQTSPTDDETWTPSVSEFFALFRHEEGTNAGSCPGQPEHELESIRFNFESHLENPIHCNALNALYGIKISKINLKNVETEENDVERKSADCLSSFHLLHFVFNCYFPVEKKQTISALFKLYHWNFYSSFEKRLKVLMMRTIFPQVKPAFNFERDDKSVTDTFIEAYPTKTIPADVLQSLLPSDWSSQCLNNFECKNEIVSYNSELPEALQLMLSVVQAEKIGKVENPYLWLQYKLKLCESQIDPEEIKYLFHGTNTQNADSIVKDNFNYRLAGSAFGNQLGNGVYFTSKLKFAAYYAKRDGCIVLAQVPVGLVCRGSKSDVLPEPYYHSTGDGKHKFAKFHDHEFYPLYLIFLKNSRKKVKHNQLTDNLTCHSTISRTFYSSQKDKMLA